MTWRTKKCPSIVILQNKTEFTLIPRFSIFSLEERDLEKADSTKEHFRRRRLKTIKKLGIMEKLHRIRASFYQKTRDSSPEEILPLIKETSSKMERELTKLKPDPTLIITEKHEIPEADSMKEIHQIREQHAKYGKWDSDRTGIPGAILPQKKIPGEEGSGLALQHFESLTMLLYLDQNGFIIISRWTMLRFIREGGTWRAYERTQASITRRTVSR